MADEYLCPKEHVFCPGRGCVSNGQCVVGSSAAAKPGYKTKTKDVLTMIENKCINAQNLFNSLSNITAWTKDPKEPPNEDVIRFCAKLENQCLWVKMVKHSHDKDSAYACSRNEHKFFTKGLSRFTPHIVQCAASKMTITDKIVFTGNNAIDQVILRINGFCTNKEKLIGVFYMQPEKWMYLESFMDLSKGLIVTQEMIISILFQLVYTIACLQSQQIVHCCLRKPKTIALDLEPKEKSITYFRNNETYVVPINVKVIILNWEDVKESNDNTDIEDIFERFTMLLTAFREISSIKTFLEKKTETADNLLTDVLFERFTKLAVVGK